MPEWLYPESEVARASGLATKKIAALRMAHLKQAEDWELVELRVSYSDAGLERLGYLLTSGVELAARLKGTLQKKVAPAPVAKPMEGRIVRFYRNPHLMQVRLENDRLVDVRVRTVVNLREGMAVPVRATATAGLYELARRLPRFPGRW